MIRAFTATRSIENIDEKSLRYAEAEIAAHIKAWDSFRLFREHGRRVKFGKKSNVYMKFGQHDGPRYFMFVTIYAEPAGPWEEIEVACQFIEKFIKEASWKNISLLELLLCICSAFFSLPALKKLQTRSKRIWLIGTGRGNEGAILILNKGDSIIYQKSINEGRRAYKGNRWNKRQIKAMEKKGKPSLVINEIRKPK
jgi:hypothetical protein